MFITFQSAGWRDAGDRLGCDFDAGRILAVGHAGDGLHIRPIITVKIAGIRHFDAGERFFVQYEIIIDDIVEIQHVGRDCVNLVVAQRLRLR